nr:reverse transcriptase domain-containing protein [Tanacetum cinerariifolium]
MSSPNHLISNIEDAFSEYILVVPDYSSASPDKTYYSASNNSTDVTSPTSSNFSLFHNDHYINVMNAYATFTPSPIPIPPPTIKSPSDSLEFFLPKELLSPKKQKQDQYFQDYEMGESSHESTLEQHEKQIKEILNHLDELPLDHIERIEDDVEGLGKALEIQTTIMAEADNSIRNTRPREIPVAKKGNYKEFISCQPFYFNCIIFQNLVVLCPNMVPNNKKLMEVFIGRLPRSIEGNVTALKPQTLEEAINIAQRLIDQVTKHNLIQGTNDHKRKFEDKRNISSNNNYRKHYQNIRNNRMNDFHQQQNRRLETFRSYAATPTENRGYTGNRLLCQRCTLHHTGHCTIRCQVCNKVGHLRKNCRNKGPATENNLQPVSVICHACGEKGHYQSQCSKTNINTNVRTYLLRDKNAHQDPNVVTELAGLPPVRQVEFWIGLIPRAAPIDRAPYRLAPSKMQELSNQLQELADRARDALKSTNGDDSHNSRTGVRRTERAARECTYTDFLNNCVVENQVKFATCTLHSIALTWWNTHVKTVGHDAAYRMPWKTLMKMMNDKYYPRNEIKKLEMEIWDLKVASDDLRDALSVLYLISAHLRGSVSARYRGYTGGYVLGIHVKDMVGLYFRNFMCCEPVSL